MIEFVIVVALFASLLAAIFFFGWSMGNQQNIKVAARYQAWKQVRSGTGMGFDIVNSEFLQSRAAGGSQNPWRFPLIPREDYISSINDTRAQNVATDELLNGYFAGISSVQYEVVFPYEGGIYSHLEGQMYSGHVRDGAEWYLEQAENLQPLVTEFYWKLDDTFESLPDDLGEYLRDLYLQRWARHSSAYY